MVHRPPYYGKKIDRKREQEEIQTRLDKYKHLPVDEALQKKVYDELQEARRRGEIAIPFEVVIMPARPPAFRAYLEVRLATHV